MFTFLTIWDKCLFLLYTYLKLYKFLPTVCNVETESMRVPACICALTCDEGEGVRGGEKEILVQLNLINSEMEIISAWSTGETRDGMRESNRKGKSERTNRRESGGTFGESWYFSLIKKSVNPHSLPKMSDIRAYFCLLPFYFQLILVAGGMTKIFYHGVRHYISK